MKISVAMNKTFNGGGKSVQSKIVCGCQFISLFMKVDLELHKGENTLIFHTS